MQRLTALLIAFVLLVLASSPVGDRRAAAQRSDEPSSAKPPAEKPSSAAQNKSSAKGEQADAKGKARSKRPPGVTATREAAVMTFVRQHHPDLEALLVYLKAHRRADYAKAIRELFNVSERLARVQEQDEGRYELELAQWKLRSRIQLLVARMRTDTSEALRDQLRHALAEQVDLQLKILQRDRDRVRERLEKLEAKIERLSESKQQEAERQFRVLMARPKKDGKEIPVSKKDASAAKKRNPTASPK
jgi:hypothetical protein